MTLTPLTIYQREFKRKTLNGLDPEDVETFLFEVAEGLETLLNENEELRRCLDRQVDGMPEAAKIEGDVRSEASSGSGVARESERARREAKRLTSEGEAEARRIVSEARSDAERILSLATKAAGARQQDGDPMVDATRDLAREYQAVLIQHLSRVSAILSGTDGPGGDSQEFPDALENDLETTGLNAKWDRADDVIGRT